MERTIKLYLCGISLCILILVFIGLLIIQANHSSQLETSLYNIRKNANTSWTCQEYSSFYAKEFEKRNIKYLVITIEVSNENIDGVIYLKGHQFIIAYSNEGYCKLDRDKIQCLRYT